MAVSPEVPSTLDISKVGMVRTDVPSGSSGICLTNTIVFERSAKGNVSLFAVIKVPSS